LDAFSVFKKGINPKWEDPKNTKGCQLDWEMRIDEKNDTLIDVIWEDLVIACLGQILEDGNDDICGIRAVDRSDRPTGKFYRLELWMDGNTTDANVDKIKARLLEAVDGDRFAVKPDFKFSRRPT
jgi:translation initiation factor 4E